MAGPAKVHHIWRHSNNGNGMWLATCGVNNQVRKPGTEDPEQVTCFRCLDSLTRP